MINQEITDLGRRFDYPSLCFIKFLFGLKGSIITKLCLTVNQKQDKKPSPQLQTWLKSRLIARETIRLLGLL